MNSKCGRGGGKVFKIGKVLLPSKVYKLSDDLLGGTGSSTGVDVDVVVGDVGAVIGGNGGGTGVVVAVLCSWLSGCLVV